MRFVSLYSTSVLFKDKTRTFCLCVRVFLPTKRIDIVYVGIFYAAFTSCLCGNFFSCSFLLSEQPWTKTEKQQQQQHRHWIEVGFWIARKDHMPATGKVMKVRRKDRKNKKKHTPVRGQHVKCQRSLFLFVFVLLRPINRPTNKKKTENLSD